MYDDQARGDARGANGAAYIPVRWVVHGKWSQWDTNFTDSAGTPEAARERLHHLECRNTDTACSASRDLLPKHYSQTIPSETIPLRKLRSLLVASCSYHRVSAPIWI